MWHTIVFNPIFFSASHPALTSPPDFDASSESDDDHLPLPSGRDNSNSVITQISSALKEKSLSPPGEDVASKDSDSNDDEFEMITEEELRIASRNS